jgi:hypothetical protein
VRFLSLFLLPLLVFATDLTVTTTTPAVRPGQSVVVSVNLNNNTNSAVAVQFNEVKSNNLPVPTVADGGILAGVSKSIACGPTFICIVYGFNTTVLPNGEVGRFTFAVPTGTTPGSATVALTGPLAANGAGASVPITVGGTLTLTILAPADLNGDGVINSVDLLISVNQIVGITPCTSADLNADGKCDLLDAMVLLKAAGL